MKTQQIQTDFCQNVCRGFLLYCNDNKISITSNLKARGKLTKQSVYAVSNGKKKYIPFIALCYLAEILGFNSPSTLEQYYINSK